MEFIKHQNARHAILLLTSSAEAVILRGSTFCSHEANSPGAKQKFGWDGK
jgi:hypothetical protein